MITIRVSVVEWPENFSSAFVYIDVTQLKEVPYWKDIVTFLHSPPGSTERLVTGSADWYNPATGGQAPTAGRSKYVFHRNLKLYNKKLISNKWSIIFWQEIKDSLPAPDIRPLEDRLNYLKKNIFKSLPNSRLTSKTDSPAYSRAATHVLAFKVQDSVHVPLLFAFEDLPCPKYNTMWESAANITFILNGRFRDKEYNLLSTYSSHVQFSCTSLHSHPFF